MVKSSKKPKQTKEFTVKMQKKLIISLVCTAITQLFGCPYTFINDTEGSIILVENITQAQFVPAGESAVIEAPMSDEHKHDDTAHRWNGHAPILVYKETTNNIFPLEYKIIEAMCGADSVIKYSQLEGMSNGTIDAGRFEIKKNNAERTQRKMEKLTSKGNKSIEKSDKSS